MVAGERGESGVRDVGPGLQPEKKCVGPGSRLSPDDGFCRMTIPYPLPGPGLASRPGIPNSNPVPDSNPLSRIPNPHYVPALSLNSGAARPSPSSARSKPAAIAISAGSDHAGPKNDRPIGRPKTWPAGTVMFG